MSKNVSNTTVRNRKLGQVFTKQSIADTMVDLFDLPKNASILDPCFGGGVFIKSLLRKSFTNVTGCEIDKELVNSLKEQYTDIELFQKDFLKLRKQYDGIIMNPPYIRQEKIDDLSEYGITKEILQKQNIFSWLPKTANLYMYFVVKAIDLLKKDGQLIVIFPDSWNKARIGTLFKEHLEEKCEIIASISMENESPFDDDVMTNVSILKIVKRAHKSRKNAAHPGSFKTLDSLTIKLPAIANVRRGITTGANNLFINPPINQNDDSLVPLLSSPKSFGGYSTDKASLDKLLIATKENSSKEVQGYLDHCSSIINKNKKPKSLYEKISRGETWYPTKTFDCSGLVFSYFIRNDMKFSINPSGIMVRDNFYVITSNIDNYLLFALMNNLFTYYQLEEYGKKYGAGLLKIQCYDLERVKLPDIKNFSKEAISNMKSEARKIIETNDSNGVRNITLIIAKEIGFNFDHIVEMYNSAKSRRLNVNT